MLGVVAAVMVVVHCNLGGVGVLVGLGVVVELEWLCVLGGCRLGVVVGLGW